MNQENICMEVVVRFFNNYVDLWFNNQVQEYMKEHRGEVSAEELLSHFMFIQDDLVFHLSKDIQMDKLVSLKLIDEMVEKKHEAYLRGLISATE